MEAPLKKKTEAYHSVGNKVTNTRTLSRSLFKGTHEYRDSLRAVDSVLTSPELKKDRLGLADVVDIAAAVRALGFGYFNRAHLYEIFTRDSARVYRLEDDRFGRAMANADEPPEYLYFGTLRHLTDVIKNNGIRSNKRPFFYLFESEAKAIEFAERFRGTHDSEPVGVCVLAKEAHFAGLSFSKSRNSGEWLSDSVTADFILEN